MKRVAKVFLAVLMAATMLTAAACSDKTPAGGMGGGDELPNAQTAVTVRGALNTVKVLQDEDINSLRDAALSFEAAKGETEGAQLVLRAEADTAYDVTVGALTSAAGNTIPATAITAYALKYMNISSGFTGFAAGAYPDAMIPLEYIKNAKENVLYKGKNQGLWFDLKVPENAAAGVYGGEVQITAGGKTIAVPVKLEVYDFVMPEVPAATTTYLIWRDWLIDGELDNSIEKYEDYYDLLLEYNSTAYYFPAEIGDYDGFVTALRKYYGKVAQYGIPYVDKKINGVKTIDFDVFKNYLKAIAKASTEDEINYFDKAYYYFDQVYDEVNDAKFPQTEKVIKETNEAEQAVISELNLTGEIANSVKDIRHVIPVITGWQDKFEPYKNDIKLCPIFNNFSSTENLDMYADLQKEGYDFTSYGSANFWPYAANLIDDYMITSRDLFWSRFDYGIEGDLYWNVNAYCNFGTALPVGYGRVPDHYTSPSRDGITAGDGYWLYPGRAYGSEKPFPSLRLTARRDGIDDFTYLSVLEQEYEKLADKYGVSGENIRTAIAEMNKQIYATGISKLNFEGLQAARRTVARLIEMAQSPGGVLLADFSYDENGVNFAVCAANSAELKINGETAETSATATGDGKTVTKANADYPDGGKITIAASGKSAELIVGKAYSKAIDLSNEENASKFAVNTANGSSVAYGDGTQAAHGATVKAVLAGKQFDNEIQTKGYRPYVRFGVDGLDGLEDLSFWVYNDSNDDLKINVIARNDSGVQYTVDSVTLPANGWRKISVSNFTYISRFSSELRKIETVGIDCANAPGTKNTLYISSVSVKAK
ncbi:glycoside hydrolase domain-containing protein [Pumilibacter muris]|uniref:glycoside hydrolase domain-containing protein n=1 Tax=Pumilibacter muris TaxID=2941510 RepID=UPI0020407CF8|nr:glycoside hydrolase domain-containing protein [Pumilibacter muris]